jgi:hypothetical protein
MLLLLGSSACSLPKGEAGVDASPLFAKPTIHPFLPSFLPLLKVSRNPTSDMHIHIQEASFVS